MTKQDLHRLVDSLPEGSLDPAARVLGELCDPEIAAMYTLPVDDEPYTAEERAHDDEVIDAYQRKDAGFVSMDELDAEIAD